MKKNTAALVFGILGGIFGLIGAIMWAACAKTCADVSGGLGGDTTISAGYMLGFIALGGGGAVMGLIGGIQAYGFKRVGLGLSVFALLLEIGDLVLEYLFLGGFSITLFLATILSVLMLFLATCFAARKP